MKRAWATPTLISALAILTFLGPGTSTTRAQPDPARPAGELRRSDHSGLWPFYSEERYEDGSTRHTSLFGAIRGESLANGDHSHRVLPFYNRIVTDGGKDRSLALYPLLYFGRESPLESYDLALPFWAHWKSPTQNDTLLWPLFHIASTTDPDPFRFIPALFSSGTWSDGSQQRFGVPYVLDIFERASDSRRSAWTLGALAPWGPPTRFGFALARASEGRGAARVTIDGVLQPVPPPPVKANRNWHVHVVPLFATGEGEWQEGSEEPRSGYLHTPFYGTWTSEGGESGKSIPALLSWWWSDETSHEAQVLFPFFHVGADERARTFRLLPFYASRKLHDGSRSDVAFPFLLSRLQSSEDSYENDFAWPLLHFSESPRAEAIRVLPFYDHSVDEDSEWLGIGSFLYRRHDYPTSKRTAHWYLFPLGLHERGEWGSLDWALPFWFHLDEAAERQRTRTTLVSPFYFSEHVEERTASTDPSAPDLGPWRTTSSALHIWPFYGHHVEHRGGDLRPEHAEEPEVRVDTHFVVAPLFQLEREQLVESGAIRESHIHAPWPILEHEWTPDRWRLDAFPDFAVGSGLERDFVTVYPLLSIETGPEAISGFRQNTSIIQWFNDGAEREFRLSPWIFEWTESAEERHITGPLWLFGYDDTPADDWFHLFPIGYGAWDGESTRMGLFPLYYRHDFRESPIEPWSLGRILFAWNALRNSDESYDSLLWKAVEYSRSDAGDHDFRILHRLFVHREVDGQQELTVNPFFSSRSDSRTGDSSFSLLYYVYRSSVTDGVTSRRIFGIPF